MSTLALTPTAGVQYDDEYHWATPCPAVRLCPGLKLLLPNIKKSYRENRADPITNHFSDFEDESIGRATFTVQPTEMTRIGHQMLLTDPPLSEARVRLCYRRVYPFTEVHVDTTIKEDSPLTLSGLVRSALLSKQTVWLEEEEPVVLHHWCRCLWDRACDFHRTLRRTDKYGFSLEDVVAQQIKKHGGTFLLDLELSWVDLQGIIPTAEEWRLMEQILAEEPYKNRHILPKEPSAEIKKKYRFRS